MKVPFLDLQAINARHKVELMAAAQRVIESGWYIRGEEVKHFEQEFAQYCGSRHCIGVANGLDALTLTLRAWIEMGRLRRGDEVIVPAHTYIASLLAITEVGLVPAFVEPDPLTLNIDINQLGKALSARSRAILPVHLYGQLAPMSEINQFAKDHGLWVLEDSAQAHGAQRAGRRAGQWGHASGFSFYPGKNLGALGDGGAITTDDEDFADIVRAISNYGSHKKYENRYQGVNSRLDEIQAAMLRVKLRHLDQDSIRRRAIAVQYARQITNPEIILPIQPGSVPEELEDHVFHLFVIRTNDRDALQQHLTKHDVQTVIHYPIPPHQQEAYNWRHISLPATEKAHQTVLSLPISPVMSDEQAAYVASVCNSFVSG